jgi:hypothetical protein
MCRTCHTVLEHHELRVDGVVVGQSWQHTGAVLRELPDIAGGHEPDPVLVEPTSELVTICDFCSSPGPSWRYPCESFESSGPADWPTLVMVEDWGACGPCHDLIESGQDIALVERALLALPIESRLPALRPVLMDLHNAFRAGRCGPAVPA